MNINDVEINNEPLPTDIWKAIFSRQRELAEKYSEIEGMGTLLQETHKNIQTSFGQRWIKDFAWRVTEEITEALEAKKQIAFASSELVEQLSLHYQEEMIDALHFLTELTIIAGYDEKLFSHSVLPDLTPMNEWEIVYRLGLMCNCLKNKPWKQTQMMTDTSKFEEYLRQTWLYYIQVMFKQGITILDIYDLYFKKNAVNKFRIRSKY